MTLTEAQRTALVHVQAAYIGPEGGPDEVIFNRPHLQYSVGMLFPYESEAVKPAIPGEAAEILENAVQEGDVEEAGATVPLAEDWRPSSVAISFVTDSSSVICHFSGGTYSPISDEGPPRWRRSPVEFQDLEISREKPLYQLMAGAVPFEIGSRWRKYGDAYLVTVHVRLTTRTTGDDKLDISRMLFQVGLAVKPAGDGAILEYDTARTFDVDAESAELRLRYRNRKVYAVGHGMAADWIVESDKCGQVFLTPVPAFVVPAVETTGFDEGSEEARALRLAVLCRIDSAPEEVLPALDAFVRQFSSWVSRQEARVDGFGDQLAIARTIVERSRIAVRRMEATVDLLRDPDQQQLREAFALGMAAMRLQLRQATLNRGDGPDEPEWRPFQLGFLLVSLASTVDEGHPDRELVDLIWFPTGGGKTEAYLGLAAIEIFRRRLAHGVNGAGTAVITRYTLRLLTTQQFQRTAALVCAMELLRNSDPRAKGMARFSIGLWVGNEVTPATLGEAEKALERLHKAARPEEANGFHVESCPWCETALVPTKRTDDRRRYGFRFAGRDLVIHCTNENCAFNAELPLSVIDNVLYDQPPTILLATVDKFARLQFKPEAGRLLGLNTSYRQPSIIIQDELHLLSGPLGTTVAVFDAVIQLLLSKSGSSPKVIASTATIRAAAEQVEGLYGRRVALYPPPGLDDDKTFFSRPVENGEGRLYVGLMPQSVSQASALVASTAPLVELPAVLAGEPQAVVTRDGYWTLVMYHNSLRELGRSGTLIVDDVNGRLETRAERLKIPLRRVRASRVLELTSRRGPEELPNDLRELGIRVDKSSEAIDVVLSSNMLSVGIDIPRLALMLMVGQPKTTAEYIQATSRVGRGANKGIVVTLFRSNRARDRSHFETFRSYHEALYRSVEPTSVTPWSLSSRDRSLAGALVALLRHSFQIFADDASAGVLDLNDDRMRTAVNELVTRFLEYVRRSDAIEEGDTREQVNRLLREWDLRAQIARKEDSPLRYDRRVQADLALLKRFGQSGEGHV
ncbi:helicase [Mycobacterium sp. E1715]|uniref:helicase-related protein n=1 Tax=Mycobacterium sp. E1715 TaxID=1856863 RepID=UPI0008012931|nr:helicase-related protein [Mycobacterium sp. E1715]OBH24990.1 helicase [Mycobacterium sp. E1715]